MFVTSPNKFPRWQGLDWSPGSRAAEAVPWLGHSDPNCKKIHGRCPEAYIVQDSFVT